MLETFDTVVYVLVGASFLLAALLSLAYGFVNFVTNIGALTGSTLAPGSSQAKPAQAIITFVSDLLLTLIILEVMGTVVHYLQTRATSLKPFLFIGIISATRGVLAVGARLSVSDISTITIDEFQRSMIELGVNGAVIIALGLTLRLIGRFLDDTPTTSRAHKDEPPTW